jgi:protein-S-isoprenylcysteine O-methyltransferase Ste14
MKPAPTATIAASHRTPGTIAASSFKLLLDHVGPASLWALIPLSRVIALVRYLEPGLSDRSLILVGAYVVQQLMTIGFAGFVVVMFLARGPVIGRRAPLLGQVVAIAGTFALQVPATFTVPDDQLGRLLLSGVLIAVGWGIALAGIASLNRNFGLFPEARGLVTTGLYRYVRHPLYLGEIVAGLGLTIGTTFLPAIGLFAIQCGLLYWRSVFEERALAASFPAYDEYKKKTWRFIPGIF